MTEATPKLRARVPSDEPTARTDVRFECKVECKGGGSCKAPPAPPPLTPRPPGTSRAPGRTRLGRVWALGGARRGRCSGVRGTHAHVHAHARARGHTIRAIKSDNDGVIIAGDTHRFCVDNGWAALMVTFGRQIVADPLKAEFAALLEEFSDVFDVTTKLRLPPLTAYDMKILLKDADKIHYSKPIPLPKPYNEYRIKATGRALHTQGQRSGGPQDAPAGQDRPAARSS